MEENKSQMEVLQFERGDVFSRFSDFYLYKSELGTGAFGKVVEVFDLQLEEALAVKIIDKNTVSHIKLQNLRKEADILRSLNHKNIVKFSHVRETETRLFLAMELLPGGELKSLIEEREGNFSDLEASSLMKGILEGLQYIHGCNLIHRDLKTENILLKNKNDVSSVKIADFGLSAKFERVLHFGMDQKCGTMIYMAPQILIRQDYSKSVDQWAVGIIMFAVLTGGRHPFYEETDTMACYMEKLKHIDHSKWDFSGVSPLAQSLLQRLLQPNPIDRYSVAKALTHPWITRNHVDQIPKTLKEMMHTFEIEASFKSNIRALFFLSIVKNGQCESGSSLSTSESLPLISPQYENLVNKVSEKAQNWHDSNQFCYLSKLEKDEDYPYLTDAPIPDKEFLALSRGTQEKTAPRRAYTLYSSQPYRKNSQFSISEAETSPDSPRRFYAPIRAKSKSFKHRGSFLKQSSFRSNVSVSSISNPSSLSPLNKSKLKPSEQSQLNHSSQSSAIEFIEKDKERGQDAQLINLFSKQQAIGSRLTMISESHAGPHTQQAFESERLPFKKGSDESVSRNITLKTSSPSLRSAKSPKESEIEVMRRDAEEHRITEVAQEQEQRIPATQIFSASTGFAQKKGSVMDVSEAKRDGSERPKQIVLQKHRKMSSRPTSAKFKDYTYKKATPSGQFHETQPFSLSPDKLRAPVLSGANNLFNLKIFNMAIGESGGSPQSSFAKQHLLKQKQSKQLGGAQLFEPAPKQKKLPGYINPSAPASRGISQTATPSDQSMNVSRQSTPVSSKRIRANTQYGGQKQGSGRGTQILRPKNSDRRGGSFTLGNSSTLAGSVLNGRGQSDLLYALNSSFIPVPPCMSPPLAKNSLRKSINLKMGGGGLFSPQ